jgi:SWI/SNF-related matrix-associated actin-dependent regulator of chromatin subfamily B protein 1
MLNERFVDTVVTPDLFARSLCDDFGVPTHLFLPRITAAIHEKIKEYQDQVAPLVGKGEGKEMCRGKLGMVDEVIFSAARNGVAGELGKNMADEMKVEDIVLDVEPELEKEVDDGETKVEDVDVKVEDLKVEKIDERALTVEEAMSLMKQEQGEELRILIKVSQVRGYCVMTS